MSEINWQDRAAKATFTVRNFIDGKYQDCVGSKTIEKYLGQKFITGYVAVKRAEHENFKRVISSWEREFLLLSV